MSSEKQSIQSPVVFEKCSLVLVDVLGTTTSINFAKDTLFPYVIKNVEEVLKEKWEAENVKSALKQLKEDEELNLDETVKLVKDLTEKGSENPGLKVLQGIICEKGYESGDLKAHVFSDVPNSLESWAKTRKVAVYSSGSVDSQKLLFSKTTEGDLSTHIYKYFDQSVGPKTEADSYKKIAEQLSTKPEEILFITDLIEEAKAANEAGLSVAVITREGNTKLPEKSEDFPVISSFKEVTFENSSKRKNVDDVTEEPPSKLAKTEAVENAKAAEKKDEGNKVESDEKVEDEAMEVDSVTVSKSALEDANSDQPEQATELSQKTEAEEKTESKPVAEDVPMADACTESTPKEEIPDSKQKTEVTVDSTTKTDESAKKEKKVEHKETIENEKESADSKETGQETKENVQKTKASVQESKESVEPVKESVEPVKESVEPKDIKEVEVDSTSRDVKDEKLSEEKVDTEKSEQKAETTEQKPKTAGKEVSVAVETPKEKKEPTSATVSSEVVNGETDEVKKSEPAEPVQTASEITSSDEKTDPVEAAESSTEPSNVKTDEEKENNKDLANGLENGQKDEADVKEDDVKVNGDAVAEENGKAESAESASTEEKLSEIKAKKAETESPAVTVEV